MTTSTAVILFLAAAAGGVAIAVATAGASAPPVTLTADEIAAADSVIISTPSTYAGRSNEDYYLKPWDRISRSTLKGVPIGSLTGWQANVAFWKSHPDLAGQPAATAADKAILAALHQYIWTNKGAQANGKPPSADDLQRGFQVLDGCDIVALDEPRALAWIAEIGARPGTSLEFDRWGAFGGCKFWNFKPSLFAYKMLRTLFLAAPPPKANPKFASEVLADMMARAAASGLSIVGWPPLP